MPEANPAEARGNAHAPKAIRIYKLIVIRIFAGFFEIYIRCKEAISDSENSARAFWLKFGYVIGNCRLSGGRDHQIQNLSAGIFSAHAQSWKIAFFRT